MKRLFTNAGNVCRRIPNLPDGSCLQLESKAWPDAFSKQPVGAAIWPSAAVLITHLLHHARHLHNTSVCELGSGTGVVGIFAAHLGPRKCVLTDTSVQSDFSGFSADNQTSETPQQTVLPLLQQNVDKYAAALHGVCTLDVQELTWGCKNHIEKVVADEGGFDVILGSDLLYEYKAHASLAKTLKRLLTHANGSYALLAHQQRIFCVENSQCPAFSLFEKMAVAEGLQSELVDKVSDVVIYRWTSNL